MPRLLHGALWCAVLASACQGPGSDPGPASAPVPTTGAEPAPGAETDGETEGVTDAVAAEAIRCIEEGRFERARDLLGDRLLVEPLARARAELAGGSPEDALTAVDHALRIDPEHAGARLLKADASLRLAEAKITGGGGSAGLIEGALGDALEYYRTSAESAHTLLGASRAAWLLGQREVALDYARRGIALRGADEGELGGLQPERIYAEQVYDAYARARAESSPESSALFLEAEDALAKHLGRAAGDAWAWAKLSDLYEWEGQLAEAKGACERGLARLPGDAGLLERLARVSQALAGPEATVKTFEAYVSEHGDVAAGRWHLAVARFQLALAGYKSETRVLDPAPFSAAEEEFQRVRAAAPELATAALGYEVVCRLARGWCAFHAGDLERAQREFLSMSALFERGIEWSLPGELESGIQGLFFVADAYGNRDDLLSAGGVFETLHGLQPESVDWANNAGFFLRDAAFALEGEGKKLCRAARGKLSNAEAMAEVRALAGIESVPAGSQEEREAMRRAADERFERALAIMERSWKAYRPAAELAPEDVRVVNDAALVLVYYLHHDLDWAEQALLRCVELGGPQIEAKKAALASEESPERASALESELAQLTEAWGDAHQNLGVLEWVHRKNAAAAQKWLEKSVEIWPSRQPVTNSLLPQIRGERAPEEEDHWDLLNWAKPCRTP